MDFTREKKLHLEPYRLQEGESDGEIPTRGTTVKVDKMSLVHSNFSRMHLYCFNALFHLHI